MNLLMIVAMTCFALLSTRADAQTVIEGPDAETMYTTLEKAGFEPMDVDGMPAIFVTDPEECFSESSSASCATLEGTASRTHEFTGASAQAFIDVLVRAQVPSSGSPGLTYRIFNIACGQEPGTGTACQFDLSPSVSGTQASR